MNRPPLQSWMQRISNVTASSLDFKALGRTASGEGYSQALEHSGRAPRLLTKTGELNFGPRHRKKILDKN